MTNHAGKRLDRYPDFRLGKEQLEFGNDRRLIASLGDALPELRPSGEAGHYVLTLQAEPHRLDVVLDGEALCLLGQQCLPLLHREEPSPGLSTADDELREAASLLKELDDRAIQCLLRDCSSDLLILFLWYMKDAALIRKLLHNCSQRAAQMLLADLVARKEGQNPDQASEEELEIGREATRTVLKTVQHLARKGLYHLKGEE